MHLSHQSPSRARAATLALVLSALAVLQAQEPTAPIPVTPDDDLPQPISAQDTADLLTNSPFTRSLDLEDSLQLTGVAYVDGRPVVTVYDRETKQSILVSEEPNAHGWSLRDVSAPSDLHGTQATVMIGQEIVHLGYGDEQLTPGSGKKGMPTAYVARTETSTGPPQMPRLSPGGSPKVRVSSYLGERGREMYASLSDQARDRLKDAVRARFEKRPDLTEEQRQSYVQKLYASIKSADAKRTSASTSSKAKKTPKRDR